MKKTELRPFDKVLVRDGENKEWQIEIFERYVPRCDDGDISDYPYYCMSDVFQHCIPYEGNEHLLGTKDPYEEPYTPHNGDFVYCKGECEHILIFDRIEDRGIYLYIELYDKFYLRESVNLDLAIMKEIRPATEEEKQSLLDKLHEEGKDWDAEKKQVVDQQYEPKPGDYVRYNFFNCSWIAIFKKKYGNLDAFHAAVYMKQGPTVLNIDGAFDYKNANRRKATEEEKKKLDDALKASGKVYDQKEGKLVDLERGFKVGDKVFEIDYNGSGENFHYTTTYYSPILHQVKEKRNMLFKTEQEAKLRVQELNKAIFKE